MAVMFSGASIDERGKISGGVAGDQTGKEVRTTSAYNHKLGWRIFRHPNANTAKWIGLNAKAMADNNNFGYDQGQRTTGYTACKNAGWEPKNVKSPCELDCSELVRTAIACALEKDVPDFNTSSEPNVLLNLGFKEVTNWSLNNLQLGDIVCTKTKGHTEVVSSGATVTPTPTPAPTPKPTPAPATKANTFYQVKAGGKHYAEVKNLNDYAGVLGKPITDVAIKVDKGTISYRVHVKSGGWLSNVSGYDWLNVANGYAGNGKAIDALQITSRNTGGRIKYRVHTRGGSWLPWVYENTDYAGVFGRDIDAIQVVVE